MDSESALGGLLDRAGNVFSLADDLGRAFHEQGLSRAIFYDPLIWQGHAPTFNEFCNAILELKDAMQNPPEGFGPIVQPLWEAARIAKGIRNTLAQGEPFTAYLDFFPDLNTVSQAGWNAVKQVTTARRLDDPFAFVDNLTQFSDEGPDEGPKLEDDGLTEVAPPYLLQVKQWLEVDGIKGHWEHSIAEAKIWDVEVDARHRNIAFLLRQVFGGDPPEGAIREYLFRAHGILPSDPVDLAKLEQILRGDADSLRSNEFEVDTPELNEQSAAGMDDAKPLADSAAKIKRPGRKADYEIVQKDAAIAAEWERARDSGVYKPVFAKEKGTTLAKLDALLDRVAKRKKRSDN